LLQLKVIDYFTLLLHQYTMSEKMEPLYFLPLTLPNADRFSKFFHRHT